MLLTADPLRTIRSTDRAAPSDDIGGKARALAELGAAGFNVPAWFVIPPGWFWRSLSPEQQASLNQSTDPSSIEAIAGSVVPSPDLAAVIQDAMAWLCPDGDPVAVRSSASDEDGAEHSFAGQLESYLFVPREQILERVAGVWRSGYTRRVVHYRQERGLPLPPRPPAVLVQRMVNAAAAGVVFSADPVSGRRGIAIVAAVSGLGSSLVSGECDADTYAIDRQGHIVERQIAVKSMMHLPGGEGDVQVVPVSGDESDAPAITDQLAVEIAILARQAEAHFGRPQDVEWAFQDQLYLLQSRPITTLAPLPDPEGAWRIWDNSNIAESYGGVTTPLTYSFARTAYESVYRQFLRILGVSERKLQIHDSTLRAMIGLIQGRIYYNLGSWYRLLALLPGFGANHRFMEQMMGVREGFPPELLQDIQHQGSRWSDTLALVKVAAGLVASFVALPRSIRQFYDRLDAALLRTEPSLQAMRPDELVEYYHRLERDLLAHWDAPLENDLFAMIFYGALRRLVETAGLEAGLTNALVSSQGGIISAEPVRRVQRLATLAAADPSLADLLCTADAARIGAALPPALRQGVMEYLEQFGDRCLDELKLESPTLWDDPLPLYRSIGSLAKGQQAASGPLPGRLSSDRSTAAREAGERQVLDDLRRQPLRRLLFRWVLSQARQRVRDRENLRFQRTRIFGRVRQILVELGRRLYALDRLADPRDVFYLEVEEILGFVEGTTTSVDLKGLAALRRREFNGYRQIPAPPDRFETRGPVDQASPAARGATVPPDGTEMQGSPCCAGTVRAPVRVIRDPRDASLPHGCILVAERTDPGWVLLFSAAAGLLVERGSLLSHSAIVAREMGLPAIVALPGITAWLQDGDVVEMDGAAGTVRRVQSDPA